MQTGANAVYQLKVTLVGARPPIWRRLLVDPATTFRDLHRIIQVAMGWHGAHLHLFQAQHRQIIGDPEEDMDGFWNFTDEAGVQVGSTLRREKQSLRYEYDFGDGWEHTVLLEKILPGNDVQPLPCCIKAVRQCPPEDVGGLHGFYEFLEAMEDATHPEHESVREWMGGYPFEPEFTDIDQINDDLLHRNELFADSGAVFAQVDFQGLSPDQVHELLQNPLDCPSVFTAKMDKPKAMDKLDASPILLALRALIGELQGRGIRLTPKGNLPLKIVNSLLEAGGEALQPPHIRSGLASIRSEEHVRPVHLTRLLAELAGFTRKEKGRLLLKRQAAKRAEKGDWLGLYLDLLGVGFHQFNWGWMDHYPDLEGIQIVGPFGLWLLACQGDKWQPASTYQQQMLNAFPALLDNTEPLAYATAEEQVYWALSSRMIELYDLFGLLELSSDRSNTRAPHEQRIKRTQLFEALFKP
jgi:hypothetical protein